MYVFVCSSCVRLLFVLHVAQELLLLLYVVVQSRFNSRQLAVVESFDDIFFRSHREVQYVSCCSDPRSRCLKHPPNAV